MQVRTYVYDSDRGDAVVEAVVERLAERDEAVEHLDLAAADDRGAARREAMLTIRESVSIGENPDGVYDAEGNLDLSPGVLVTEAGTGRRSVHVGREALEVLESEADRRSR